MEYCGKKTLALVQEIIKMSDVIEMRYSKVIKLLYFCDRQMYQYRNISITGDNYISTATGPVLTITQCLIQEEILHPNQNTFFHEHFEIQNSKIRIKKEINETNLLSENEKMIANDYAKMFGDLSTEQLSEMTYRVCSEWTDPTKSEKSSYAIKISEEDIKKAITN